MIELKNICAGYGKGNVLKNFSVCFEKGKLLSVIGRNGSGKSTTLKTAVGVITPTSGEIFINGESALNMKKREIARRAAYLSQGRNTPDMTVKQLVLHGRFSHLDYPRRYSEKDREIAIKAMEQTGILNFAEKPLGVLSGGMRQNAYVAMALAQSTDYIFLDEPTTYLDISNQLSLMKTLKGLAKEGKGIVTVMHDLPLAFTFSDIIVLMDGGKLVAKDTPENLCKSEKIREVFGVSFEFNKEQNCYCYNYKV